MDSPLHGWSSLASSNYNTWNTWRIRGEYMDSIVGLLDFDYGFSVVSRRHIGVTTLSGVKALGK